MKKFIDYLNQIVSSLSYFYRNIETHGVISNHLVTVMLAKLLAAKYLNIKLPINEKADVFKLLDKMKVGFLNMTVLIPDIKLY